MEYIETDILIVGSSIYAISLAISLGNEGKDILIIETDQEHAIRGFYKVGKTKLNDTPIEGYIFDEIMVTLLNKSGVKFRRDIMSIDRVHYNKSNAAFTINSFSSEIKANEIICAPNIIPVCGEPPLTTKGLETLQWSACAWSDAFFFKNQKTGVYGNGSWSANHALNAFNDKNEVTIYNPDKTFFADDYLLAELKKLKIQIINGCKQFKLIAGKENSLEYVEYESKGIKFKDECKIIYEGRVTSSPEKYFTKFPKVDRFTFCQMNSLMFEHEKQFELSS